MVIALTKPSSRSFNPASISAVLRVSADSNVSGFFSRSRRTKAPQAKPAISGAASALRGSVRVRHGNQFCPDEPRNATQLFCGAMR